MVCPLEGGRQPPALSSVFTAIQQQSDRITAMVGGIFQQLKQSVLLIWKMVVVCVTQSTTSVTFLFFRVLNFFRPSLAAKLELICLYATNYWNDFWARSREEELRNHFAHQNGEQERVIRQLTDQLRDARVALNQEKEETMRDRSFAAQQTTALRVQLEATCQQRDAALRVFTINDAERTIMQQALDAVRLLLQSQTASQLGVVSKERRDAVERLMQSVNRGQSWPTD